MKSLALLCATAAMALSLTACNQAPPAASSQAQPDTHDADIKALNDVEAKDNSDWAAKNLDGLAAFYADDAVLMTPGGAPMKGKDAIRAGLTQMLADKALNLTFKATTVDVAKSGDLGYTQGDYTMAMTNPATHKVVTDHGTYVTVYRKQADGSWKAISDIATPGAPPAPAKH